MADKQSTIWVFGDDVDTDQIIASQYIILPSIDEMKVFAFESLDKDFASSVKPGDIIIAGNNFGCGSSREQAPSVLKALGIKAVVAKSFARIFFRNSINIGLPVVICDTVQQAAKQGDKADIDLSEGVIEIEGNKYTSTKLPEHMQKIINGGGLIEFLNSGEGEAWG